MAHGKQIGEMSLKVTSMTFIPGPGNSALVQVNFEGPSPQYGVVARSATFSPAGGKSGTYTACGAGYLANGDTVTGTGQGTVETIGIHKWKSSEVFTFADGTAVRFVGVVDLAARSWIGTIHELA